MKKIEFSDALLDASYKVLFLSKCGTERERELFATVCEICDKHDLSVRKFMDAFDELINKLQETEKNNAKN